jgi:hypothetical protein
MLFASISPQLHYDTASPDQQRNADVLSLENPPSVAEVNRLMPSNKTTVNLYYTLIYNIIIVRLLMHQQDVCIS